LDREPRRDRERPDGSVLPDGGGFDGGQDGAMPASCDDDNGGCSPLVDCQSNEGKVECGACPSGTEDVNSDGTVCRDIDECELDLDECDINPKATCINTMSSYRCRCPEGTSDPMTGGRNCTVAPPTGPVDECALERDDCDEEPEASCADETNGFTCTCPAGYEDTVTNGTDCVDIDECELGLDDCDEDPVAECENTPGGFTCSCPDGFEDPSDTGTDCRNVDDCAGDTECDDEPDACVDGVDGYACVCPDGYDDTHGDGTVCENVDECADDTDACDDGPVATCMDTIGSYECECPAGSTDPIQDGTICTEPKTRVALGGRHACAIFDGGEVHCWGHNNKGQLGIGSITGPNEAVGDRAGETGDALPVVDIGGRAIALAAGCAHTCALLPDGQVKCWGNNDFGQLGLGDDNPRGTSAGQMGSELPAVPLNAATIAITAGCNFSCSLLVTGDVVCWGDNGFGQLGQGNTNHMGDDADEVNGLSPIALDGDAKAIRAGYRFVCAQLETDQIKCWGRNGDGQLGLNDIEHRGDEPNEMGDALPVVNLGTGREAKDFAAGYTHACALLDNNTVKCWGGESDGGTGYGDTTINRGDGIAQEGETTMGMEMGNALPAVGLPATPTAISAQRHTCVLFSDDTVGCFGRNNAGELGIGSKEARGDQPGELNASFLKAPLGTETTAIAVFNGPEEGTNDANSCALLLDGRLKCWGANARGQLGLGDGSARGDDPNEMGDALPTTVNLW
jgi:alpha-tubulin suppressor-like RCC1 family protein